MFSTRKSTYIVAAPLLLLASAALSGCVQAVDQVEICDAALDGIRDPDYAMHKRCQGDVWRGAKTAAHKAAQPYRDLPRQY